MTRQLLNLGCGALCVEGWVNADVAPSRPDVIPLDASGPLPFAHARFEAVYCSHVLEHLPRDAAPGLMAECLRVLRPGGILRVAVPDLETIARLYLDRLEKALAGGEQARHEYDWMLLELLDQPTRDRPGGYMLGHWQKDPMPAGDFVAQRMGWELEQFLRNKPASRVTVAPLDDAALGRFRRGGEPHLWMYDRFSLGRLLAGSGFEDVRVVEARESSIPGFADFRLDVLEDGRTRKPDSLFMEGRRP